MLCEPVYIGLSWTFHHYRYPTTWSPTNPGGYNNTLAKYLKRLREIDAVTQTSPDWMNGDVTGLNGFIAAVGALRSEQKFINAQLHVWGLL